MGDDDQLCWAKAEAPMAEEFGTFPLAQGFIALTGMLLQEFEHNVDRPISNTV